MLRYGITSRPPHFDVHQSGTINSLGSQGCMFDNLVRRDPRDSGKTIIPDLAHSWEIAKDGKTYTFFLRKDVQFHDGAEFTAEDVKATYDRISKPPAGISIPRSILFSSVSEINVRDKHTIEFKLSQPRPANFIMSGFASGWNVIVRKKTLEDNQQNLRRVVDIPGTGPFKSKRRVENEVWVMERNRTTGTRKCPISTASSSITACRSRPSWARPSCRAAPTTRASSIRSRRARPRRRPACPRSTSIRA